MTYIEEQLEHAIKQHIEKIISELNRECYLKSEVIELLKRVIDE